MIAPSSTLENHIRQGVVVFCGAGVSIGAPACLPSWWKMNEEVVRALSRQIEPFCGAERAADWAKQIDARRESKRFPPEFQAEVIAKRYGAGYFKVLQSLDGDEPNLVHFAIAALAKAGHVRAVVTSNFDRLLEVAFEKSGVPLDVYYHAAHFERLASELEASSPSSRCRLLKLHGSVEDHHTLVDTLAQRMRGLPPAICTSLQQLLRNYFWVFLGYSGRDLEGNPQYLCLQSEAGRAVGFTWLVRDSAQDEPLSAVVALCNLYGERADAPRGELPGWFLTQFEPFLPQDFPRPPTLSDDELNRRKNAAAQRIVDHTREWSIELGPVRSALAIADMLDRSVANPQAAEELLRATLSAQEEGGNAYVVVANTLMNTLAGAGRFDEAIALGDKALAQIGASDVTDRAGLLSNMGLINYQRGEYRQALERFEQQFEVSTRSNDEDGKSIALNNRAMALTALGHPGEAMACYEEELVIVRASGDALAEAQTLNNMGNLLREQGRYAEAIEVLRRAIGLRERLGDDRGVGSSLGNIAATQQRQGEFVQAKATYEQILATFQRIGDRAQETTTLRNLGSVVQELGDFAEAERLYRQAIGLAAEHGMDVQRAGALMKLGSLYRTTERAAEAWQLLDEALTIYTSSGDKNGQADVLNEAGIVHWQGGELDTAEAVFNQVIAIREQLNQPAGIRDALNNLAGVLIDKDHLGDQSLDSFERAQGWFLERGQTDKAMDVLAIMGEICGRHGKIGASLGWFDRAIPLAANADQRSRIATRLSQILMLLLHNGYEDVGQHYVQRLESVGAKVNTQPD